MKSDVLYQQSEALTKKSTLKLTGNSLLISYSSWFRKINCTVGLEAIHPMPQIYKEGYSRYWYIAALVVLVFMSAMGSSLISSANAPEEKAFYLTLLLLSGIAILGVLLGMVINGKRYLLFLNHNKNGLSFKLRYRLNEQDQIEQLISDLTNLQSEAIEHRIDKDTKKLKEGIETLFQRKILNQEQYTELMARISVQKSSLLE